MFYIMIAINIIYVSSEFVFNFILLNTSSTQVRLEDIHSVEILGRSLAAFGFTFILWKLIQSLKLDNKMKVFSIVVITLISYPSFYFGQEALVQSLADKSSLETREKMNSIFLLKQGLLNGSLQLDTVPYNESIKDLPESKTFITNIPLFIMNNEKVLSYLKNNSVKVAETVFKADVLNDPVKYVNVYSMALEKLDMKYNTYDSHKSSLDIDINRAVRLADGNYDELLKYLNWLYGKEGDTFEYDGMSFSNYLKYGKIQNVIKDKIFEKSKVKIDGFVDVSSKSAFRNTMKKNVSDKYKSSFGSVPMGIKSKNEFRNNPTVKAEFKTAFDGLYVGMVFNEDSFNGMNLEEDINVIKNNADNIAMALAKEFAKKDLMSDEGASIVKAMIIPPLALLFSLFFGFINFIILVKTILNKNIKNKKVNNFIILGLVSFILVFPLLLNNKYTESSSYKKVLVHVENKSAALSLGVDWIMKLEPFVYSYGSIFIED